MTGIKYTNVCIYCGELIPEGHLLCWRCEHEEELQEDFGSMEWLLRELHDPGTSRDKKMLP